MCPDAPARPDCPPDDLQNRLGAAEYYRLWCSAEQFPLNEYRRIEFCGWLVGYGEAIVELPADAARGPDGGVTSRRTEVDMFLTTDGKIVTAVELMPTAGREFASSPPDFWATFLGEHDGLDAARAWLRAVEQVYGATPWRAVAEALAQAGTNLAAVKPEAAIR